MSRWVPAFIATNTPKGFLEQAVIGNILGDAWLERKSPKANARFRFEQASPKHDERFYYIYKIYALFCAGNSRTRVRTDSRSGKVYSMNIFTTRAIPFFTYYYELFYINGVKTIPSNIRSLLTPVAVAFWIMDDGHVNSGLTLNTQGFSIEGVNLLVARLNDNFNIHSYLRMEKDQPTIYIPKKDAAILAEVVLPYMHPSTHYKLGLAKL